MSASRNLQRVIGKTSNVYKATQGTRGLKELAALAAHNNELTTKWLNRLRDTAHNNESREMQAQLSSILDYYNKQSSGTETLAPIDWASYEKSIHTPDIV